MFFHLFYYAVVMQILLTYILIQPKTGTERSTPVAPEVDIPSSDQHVTANDGNENLESKFEFI